MPVPLPIPTPAPLPVSIAVSMPVSMRVAAAPARLARAARLALAALLALPAPAQAQDMEGLYKATPEADCDAPGGEGLLAIEDDVFRGFESTCRMTNPLEVRDMDATLYDFVCTAGGTVWQERAIVVEGAAGELILVWDGYAFAYPACPRPPLRPRPRPDTLSASR